MTVKVALEHRTSYLFDRPVGIAPHVVRLRPAPHTRTPIEAYSLTVAPREHYVNWQQDPFGNHLARLVFPSGKARQLDITVGLVADLTVINPFDFFVEDYAQRFPFRYDPELAAQLQPYLVPVEGSPGAGSGSTLQRWLNGLHLGEGQSTIEFLGALNSRVFGDVAYSVRMDPGVLSPDETLQRSLGSCRDSAWLLVAALRHYGLAARFVSGYLIQLAPDTVASDDPRGQRGDFTDLHAWAEVFVPGAGWIGLDATSALFAGEGHIPLAATPSPSGSAPVTGSTEPCDVSFSFSNTVRRVHEDVRVSRPYRPEQTEHLHRVGEEVDRRLAAAAVELTMAAAPTFVAADDAVSPEWTVAVDGGRRRSLAHRLTDALRERFAPDGLLQHTEGPSAGGEPSHRRQITLAWRADGAPLWSVSALLADPFDPVQSDEEASSRAASLARAVVAELGLPESQAYPCDEDPPAVRSRGTARGSGPAAAGTEAAPDPVGRPGDDGAPVAWAVPLAPGWWGEGWLSPAWRTPGGRVVLLPGDSPAARRLPLSSLSRKDPDFVGEAAVYPSPEGALPDPDSRPAAVVCDPEQTPSRTALVVEPRGGFVHVFLPPLERAEQFCQLVGVVERAVRNLGTPVVLEGYAVPADPRIRTLHVAPGLGIIEVDLQPTSTWRELADVTREVHEIARRVGLATETFGLDGRHGGTGVGNGLTLGGPEPQRSPMLRRPDLLVGMVTYWQHHPSLTYLFSGGCVGPAGHAPRVDEGRMETAYELEIAFAELSRLDDPQHRPWLVDRALRHLLADVTGNTRRSEFCIDDLYAPEALRRRLGLLHLRAFGMPPHPDMVLAQALLVRALVARLADDPYWAPLVRWGGRLHDRFLLPHFAAADLAEVVADLRAHGHDLDLAWFEPHLEFRFPRIGLVQLGDVALELRSAIEPCYVLGDGSPPEHPRHVDSSTERLQIQVDGFEPSRHLVTVNRRAVPLTPTGTPGRFVAGVRYTAWQQSSALHPTLAVDAPLTVDLVDRNSAVSLGGATYHVSHPGGRAYDTPPINAREAEARRARRFETIGHTPGRIDVTELSEQLGWRAAAETDHPLTLDLRLRPPRQWGRR